MSSPSRADCGTAGRFFRPRRFRRSDASLDSEPSARIGSPCRLRGFDAQLAPAPATTGPARERWSKPRRNGGQNPVRRGERTAEAATAGMREARARHALSERHHQVAMRRRRCFPRFDGPSIGMTIARRCACDRLGAITARGIAVDRFFMPGKMRAKGWFGPTERQKWAAPAALSNVEIHVGLHRPGPARYRVFAPCPQQHIGTNMVEMAWSVIFLPNITFSLR
jgi:hypothetical protein